jgi:hypothetical protein
MKQIKLYGLINGISRIGDVIRLYMLPWLAFYATEGDTANKVLFVSIASVLQSIPSLCLSHFSARLIRRLGPIRASKLANTGLGGVSLFTALAVLAGFTPQWLVALVWIAVGLLEVVYYPAHDCVCATLAGKAQDSLTLINRTAASTLHLGRLAISVAMIGVVWLIGPVSDEMPRGAIAAALLIDAATFGLVVAFLATLTGAAATNESITSNPFPHHALREAMKVKGAVPILFCTVMIYSFAYSSFYFRLGLYKELVGLEESERQMIFWTVQFTSALGGYFGAGVRKQSFPILVAAIIAICITEAMFALTPTNPTWGIVWLMCNSCASVMLFTAVFDIIIPRAVQGLDRNAEVSSALTFVKEGVSGVFLLLVTTLAKYLHTYRPVLFGACVVTLIAVAFTLFAYRKGTKEIVEK